MTEPEQIPDAQIISIAYDCNALPEVMTDRTMLVFARAMIGLGVGRERERCAAVCEAWAKDHAKADGCTYSDCDFVAAAQDCAAAIRALPEDKP